MLFRSHGGSRPPGRAPPPTAPASPPGPPRSRRVAGNTSRRSSSRRRRDLMARSLRRPDPDRESSRRLRRQWRYSSSGLRRRGGARTTHGLRHAPSRRGCSVRAVGERRPPRESRDSLLYPLRFPRDLRESRESSPPNTAGGWRPPTICRSPRPPSLSPS